MSCVVDKTFVENNKDKRFTVRFENGTELVNIKLFIGTTGSIGYLQGKMKRRGKYFPMYDEITCIAEVTKKVKAPDNIKNAKTILNKIHSNAWNELKQEMQDIIKGAEPKESFTWHFAGNLRFKNITAYLNSFYIQRLKDAFDNKQEFSWSYKTNHHAGRDLRISTRVCEDGVFRAWFSSEYQGCSNGDYWLLLNPTTAIYYERD